VQRKLFKRDKPERVWNGFAGERVDWTKVHMRGQPRMAVGMPNGAQAMDL
jgi:hypothetical protein